MADVTQAEIEQLQYLLDEARKQSQHPLVPPNDREARLAFSLADQVLKSIETMKRAMVAKGCRTCPHRGLPLASLPADKRGVVTCAGHGLQWNQKTGVLVREGQVVL